MQFKVTLEYCADYLGVSQDAIRRRIKEHHDKTFSQYADLKRQRTAMKLQQKAIEFALKGDRTLMIFCLKNMAGWADKQELESVSHQVVQLVHEVDDE